jgi:dihydrofolate reductase
MTFDGLIEGPNGEIDWLMGDDSIDFGDILNDILRDKDAIFYGRTSYELWGNYTPEEGGPKVKAAYELLHSKTKYVFSHSQTSDDTNAIFINNNIKEKVLAIKKQPGKNIWLYGGAQLVTTFLNLDLIDEFQFAVYPVVLGKGKPLFQDIEDRHKLKLIKSEAFPSGVLLLHYEIDRG